MEVSTTRSAAQGAGQLKAALKPSTQPARLILDALGSLPIDQPGAALLCQVISRRAAQGAIVMTSHRACQEWPQMFHPDRPLTAAILDRLRHHAETVLIEGTSGRMKHQLDGEPALHEASPEAQRQCRRCLASPLASHIFTSPVFLHFHAVANN
jgi:DNA replication protein DnaC